MINLHDYLREAKPDELLKVIDKFRTNLNEKDSSGDTLLHIITNRIAHAKNIYDLRIYFKIAKILLDKGADITLKNAIGETPIDLFIYVNNLNNQYYIYNTNNKAARFLVYAQPYLTPQLLLSLLNTLPYQLKTEELYKMNYCLGDSDYLEEECLHRYSLITDILDPKQLSLECLEALFKWQREKFKALEDQEVRSQVQKLKEELEVELELEINERLASLRKHPHFTNTTKSMCHAGDAERTALIRAMLINPAAPISTLLTEIKENFLSLLPEIVQRSFKEFIAEYECARTAMEKYKTVPESLTKTEINTAKFFYQLLTNAMLQDGIKYKPVQEYKAAVTKELNQYAERIQQGYYFIKRGFWQPKRDLQIVAQGTPINSVENNRKRSHHST